MTKKYTLVNGALTIGGAIVKLPYTAVEGLTYNGLVIVKVEPPARIIFNRNIFGVLDQGEILWQIEESPHGTQMDKPYIDIFIDPSGELIAANWNGVSYAVDPASGKISIKSFDK